MDAMRRIAEERIREAMEQGAFKNLAGSGKPLRLEDDSGVPEELRMAHKLLKNAGVLPPEMELRKELATLQTLLNCCEDDDERARLERRLTGKRLQYELTLERRLASAPAAYRGKAAARLTGDEG